jgi:hypothetical protein
LHDLAQCQQKKLSIFFLASSKYLKVAFLFIVLYPKIYLQIAKGDLLNCNMILKLQFIELAPSETHYIQGQLVLKNSFSILCNFQYI